SRLRDRCISGTFAGEHFKGFRIEPLCSRDRENTTDSADPGGRRSSRSRRKLISILRSVEESWRACGNTFVRAWRSRLWFAPHGAAYNCMATIGRDMASNNRDGFEIAEGLTNRMSQRPHFDALMFKSVVRCSWICG